MGQGNLHIDMAKNDGVLIKIFVQVSYLIIFPRNVVFFFKDTGLSYDGVNLNLDIS
jgi:hypothetical protein